MNKIAVITRVYKLIVTMNYTKQLSMHRSSREAFLPESVSKSLGLLQSKIR